MYGPPGKVVVASHTTPSSTQPASTVNAMSASKPSAHYLVQGGSAPPSAALEYAGGLDLVFAGKLFHHVVEHVCGAPRP